MHQWLSNAEIIRLIMPCSFLYRRFRVHNGHSIGQQFGTAAGHSKKPGEYDSPSVVKTVGFTFWQAFDI